MQNQTKMPLLGITDLLAVVAIVAIPAMLLLYICFSWDRENIALLWVICVIGWAWLFLYKLRGEVLRRQAYNEHIGNAEKEECLEKTARLIGEHNHNRCELCVPGRYEPQVADTGPCGGCGQINDCYDQDLIALYRGFGIDNKTIWQQLPRIRTRRKPQGGAETVSLATIGEEIHKVLAEQKNKQN